MKRLWLMFGMSLVLTSCATPSCPTNLQAWPDPSGKRINLQQCWDKPDQIRFYTTSQGSQIAPYELVEHLEIPSSTEKFLSRANIEKWRYLLLEKTDVDADSDVDKDAPDWPLGFAINDVTSGKQEWRGKWLGMTCAACHTTEIHYTKKNAKIRIDGGPTMANFNQFVWDLRDALKATYEDGLKNGQKFKRYAQNFPREWDKDLLERLGHVVTERDMWHHRNDPPTPPGPPGFARLDAVGVIFNQLIHMSGKMPVGDPKTDAPVSYPFLWDTSHHNQTQWNGVAPAIPMARNIVQALGVFSKYDPHAGLFEEPSTIRLSNQREIQKLVDKLRSPQWPGKILEEIDQAMAKEGRKLFESKKCSRCHAEQKREDELQRIKMTMTEVQDVKTDRKMVDYADHRKLMNNGKEKLVKEAAGDAAKDIVASWSHIGDVFAFVVEVVSAVWDWGLRGGLGDDDKPDDYKGRPLDGIWATAPYLHNGSVLNLYELLLPAKDRKKAFCVGSREFDPDRVGFVSVDTENDCRTSGGTWLDTTILGNSNAGHEYGACSDKDPECKKQIQQLVEYMKTL